MTTTTHSDTARPALIRTGAITALGALPIVGQLYVVLPLAAEIGTLPGASGSTAALASTAFALAYALGILALGPLGLVPLPSKWHIHFGRPIDTSSYEVSSADDPMVVFDLTDHVREEIQQTLFRMLSRRGSVYLG